MPASPVILIAYLPLLISVVVPSAIKKDDEAPPLLTNFPAVRALVLGLYCKEVSNSKISSSKVSTWYEGLPEEVP